MTGFVSIHGSRFGISRGTPTKLVLDGVTVGMASGEAALDGSNPTAVDTGLTTITGFIATLKTSTSTGVGTRVLTYTTSGGTASVYAWKPTSSSDTTLVASTGTETFGWVAFGS